MQIVFTQYEYKSYNANGVFTIPSGIFRTNFLVFEISRAHNIIFCARHTNSNAQLGIPEQKIYQSKK